MSDSGPVSPGKRRQWIRGGAAASALAALGVVYGDIGTSPLYAFKAAVQAAGGAPGDAAIGVTALIIWSLVAVVSLKYAALILRADNHGEGGVVAMLALLGARDAAPRTPKSALLVLGLLGAALLYGDGAITPAISVLGAVEGLKVDAPGLASAVVPITTAILVLLFVVQAKGTGAIGRIFGPVMLIWFVILAVLGLGEIVRVPAVLGALDPWEALRFLLHAPLTVSFGVLGAVFLAVTGGEAMYADMGHFGRQPIRLAWFAVALPALVINYMGQAALIRTTPAALDNPFYALAPGWAHYPLVVFATAAAVIASQAIISGVFSLTHQAIQLGFLPRLEIRHTAEEQEGQVYLPLANWLLAAGTLAAVFLFRSSDALAGAYGIAVSGLMAISTFLAALIALKWGYNPVVVIAANGAFFALDLVFFAANSAKLLDGGWFPLLVAGVIAFLMLTWRRGVQLVETARADLREDEDAFLARIAADPPVRVAGVGAFLSAAAEGVPLSLSHHLRHNHALQDRVLLVSVTGSEMPFVTDETRATLEPMVDGVERVILRYGFMETWDVPRALGLVEIGLGKREFRQISYYLGRETVIADARVAGMATWRERLFVTMQRNTTPTGSDFCIPSGQLIEVGTQVRI